MRHNYPKTKRQAPKHRASVAVDSRGTAPVWFPRHSSGLTDAYRFGGVR